MNLDSVCPHAERSHTVLSREGVPQVLGLVGKRRDRAGLPDADWGTK